MKKLIAILLVLVLGALPMLALAEENMLVQSNEGCVYVNGKVYILSAGEGLVEYNGTARRVVAPFDAQPGTGLLTDGENAYVLEFTGSCQNVVAIEVAGGAGYPIAELPGNASRLVGVDQGKIIYLADTLEDEPNICIQDFDSLAEDSQPFLGFIGNTMFWRGTSLFQYVQYDAYPMEFMAADIEDEELYVMGVNPCVMQAKVNRDGVYYWATDAEQPEGDYAYLALCHTDGEETTLVLDIDVPTNGAYPSKILSDYVVVTNKNPNEIFIANFRTGESGRFDGSSLTGYWFYQDEVTGSLYYYNNSTSTLYRAEINGSMQELGSFDEPVELLLIADSIIYYRNKSNGVAEALSLG